MELTIKSHKLAESMDAFWRDLENFMHNKTGLAITIMPKDIISYESDNKSFSYMTSLMLAIGKFHIHKARK